MIGPIAAASVHNSMLIRLIARKSWRLTSLQRPMEDTLVLIFRRSIRFVNTIPTNMQGRNAGSVTPACASQPCPTFPKPMHIASSQRASRTPSRLTGPTFSVVCGLVVCASASPSPWSPLRMIKSRAMGPPTMPPAMSPIVAQAKPSTVAPSSPCSCATLPQVIDVPCPPANEILPAISPYAGCCPNRSATRTPVMSCRMRNATAAINKSTSNLPPSSNMRKRAERPIVLKNANRSVSRRARSNFNWTLAV